MADIWVEGDRELMLAMQRTFDDIQKEAMEGLQKGAMNIIADAQNNLRLNKSIATGQLRQSGRVEKVDETTLNVGFFSKGSETGHAAVVEYGSRPHVAPWPFIQQWARKKSIEHLAGAIWTTIKKKGTQPHPFFAPAVKKNEKAISRAISAAIRKTIDKND